MTAPFYIKRGDTAPDLVLTLTNPDGSQPVLTSATGVLNMVDQTGALIVNRRPVVLDNTAKTARHQWLAADTQDAGLFMAEVEVTFVDGSKMTYPNDGHLAVMMTADLG